MWIHGLAAAAAMALGPVTFYGPMGELRYHPRPSLKSPVGTGKQPTRHNQGKGRVGKRYCVKGLRP